MKKILPTCLIISSLLLACDGGNTPKESIDMDYLLARKSVRSGYTDYSIYVYVNTKEGSELPVEGHISLGTPFSDGFSLAIIQDENTKQKSLQYIEKNGKTLKSEATEELFSATVFNEGRAWATKVGEFPAIIDKSGKQIKIVECDYAWPFSDGVAVTKSFDQLTIVDVNGKELARIDDKYKPLFPRFCNGVMLVKNTETGLYGAIDKKGEEVVPCIYKQIGDSYDPIKAYTIIMENMNKGKLLVADDNGWGAVDLKGRILIPTNYSYLSIDEDLYLFQAGDLYGWLNDKGKVIIEPMFVQAQAFNGGKMAGAMSVLNGQYVYQVIDRKGRPVNDEVYENMMAFSKRGTAVATPFGRGTGWGVIDSKGKWLVAPEHEILWPIGDTPMYVCELERGKYGIIDEAGKICVPAAYSSIILPTASLYRDSFSYSRSTIGLYRPAASDGSWVEE